MAHLPRGSNPRPTDVIHRSGKSLSLYRLSCLHLRYTEQGRPRFLVRCLAHCQSSWGLISCKTICAIHSLLNGAPVLFTTECPGFTWKLALYKHYDNFLGFRVQNLHLFCPISFKKSPSSDPHRSYAILYLLVSSPLSPRTPARHYPTPPPPHRRHGIRGNVLSRLLDTSALRKRRFFAKGNAHIAPDTAVNRDSPPAS